MLLLFSSHVKVSTSCINVILQKLKDVLKFLRLPYFELKSRQMKIHTAPLQNQVENWDGVERSLKGTPYESFILADQ